MHLLIGIPAFNEEASIYKVIKAIPKQMEGVSQIKVVVIDDGSDDETSSLATQAGAEVVSHIHNYGVGAAFQSMYRYALKTKADILVTLDGDGQFNPEDIPKLIFPIVEGKALVCSASRFLDSQLVPTMPWIKKWGNHRVANLVSSMTGRKYADVSCGFRAYAREALLRLTVYHSFTYTHETFLDLATKRVPIVEVPLKVRGVREHGKSKIASSVLKYGWRTGMIMLRTYRDHQPLRFFTALAIPFFILGVAVLGYSFFHYIDTNSWIKWAAFLGGAFMGLSAAFVFVGFISDIATRLRLNQEEIIYWLRQK